MSRLSFWAVSYCVGALVFPWGGRAFQTDVLHSAEAALDASGTVNVAGPRFPGPGRELRAARESSQRRPTQGRYQDTTSTGNRLRQLRDSIVSAKKGLRAANTAPQLNRGRASASQRYAAESPYYGPNDEDDDLDVDFGDDDEVDDESSSASSSGCGCEDGSSGTYEKNDGCNCPGFELKCTYSRGICGSYEDMCTFGNTKEDGYFYYYNTNRYQINAVCGRTANCDCCRRPETTGETLARRQAAAKKRERGTDARIQARQAGDPCEAKSTYSEYLELPRKQPAGMQLTRQKSSVTTGGAASHSAPAPSAKPRGSYLPFCTPGSQIKALYTAADGFKAFMPASIRKIIGDGTVLVDWSHGGHSNRRLGVDSVQGCVVRANELKKEPVHLQRTAGRRAGCPPNAHRYHGDAASSCVCNVGFFKYMSGSDLRCVDHPNHPKAKPRRAQHRLERGWHSSLALLGEEHYQLPEAYAEMFSDAPKVRSTERLETGLSVLRGRRSAEEEEEEQEDDEESESELYERMASRRPVALLQQGAEDLNLFVTSENQTVPIPEDSLALEDQVPVCAKGMSVTVGYLGRGFVKHYPAVIESVSEDDGTVTVDWVDGETDGRTVDASILHGCVHPFSLHRDKLSAEIEQAAQPVELVSRQPDFSAWVQQEQQQPQLQQPQPQEQPRLQPQEQVTPDEPNCGPGAPIKALYVTDNQFIEYYDAHIDFINSNGTITVRWDDGDPNFRVVPATASAIRGCSVQGFVFDVAPPQPLQLAAQRAEPLDHLLQLAAQEQQDRPPMPRPSVSEVKAEVAKQDEANMAIVIQRVLSQMARESNPDLTKLLR